MDREAPFQTCRVTGTLPADRPDSLVAQFPLKPPSLVRFPILTAPGLILRHVDVVLGIVLALAGTLKGQQVLADSFGGLASAAPRALLVAAALEIAFGCWLVAGLCRRITRWIAVVWFTSLAAVALASAIDGADSCGCLGEVHIRPWLIVWFDVAAIGALWMWAPKASPFRWRLPAALGLSILSMAALFSLAGTPKDHLLSAEIDLGSIAQGSQKRQAFRLLNDSGAIVKIATIEASCPCASIHLERSTVPIAQFLAGDVMMDLSQKQDFVGSLAIAIKGLTEHGQIAFVLMLRARVYRASEAAAAHP